MKNKKYNDDINYEDIEKQKICEHFGEIEQLYEETLLKNVGIINAIIMMMMLMQKKLIKVKLKKSNNY